jgi:hypothetical protein
MSETSATTFAGLMHAGHISEAVALCERHASDPVIGRYYAFWLKRLSGGAAPVLPSARVSAPPAAGPSPDGLGDDLRPEFGRHPYSIRAFDTTANPEVERGRLMAASPFKGDIYQPTEKIPLADQVRGLHRVLELTTPDNLKATRNRFDALRRMIRERGTRRVFVIGNGPSLKKTDLALLANEVTIGFNGIFLHESFTPTIYIVEDHLVAEDRAKEIHAYRCPVKLFPSYLAYCIEPQENTIFLNHRPRISYPVDTDFSADAGRISYTGGTVTYTGLQVAASLGVEEIVLIGVDASYKVHNVERSDSYGTGVLTSKEADSNHFDPRYFGKGFRWHDPNVHTMLQAYRKAREHARDRGIRIVNATIGGQLEVFPRVDYHQLFPAERAYPRLAVLDFTPLTRLCATGIVKQNLLQQWPKSSQLHVYADEKSRLVAFQSVSHDLYAPGSDDESVWPAFRSLVEYAPDVLYLRPTPDRVTMTAVQVVAGAVLGKPWVMHYMDDWMARVRSTGNASLADAYAQVLRYLVGGATRVLSISDKMLRFLELSYALPEGSVGAIHNFAPPARTADGRTRSGERVVRYFGGLEPDMGLSTLVEFAGQIEAWNARGNGDRVGFAIHASPVAIAKHGAAFTGLPATRLLPPIEDYDRYLEMTAASDLNLIVYNFDPESVEYVRYSLANKLPELIACGAPFLAIGHPDIGTIELLREVGYPLVLTERAFDIAPALRAAFSPDAGCSAACRDALEQLKLEFSEEKNRCGFHAAFRAAAHSPRAPGVPVPVAALRLLVEDVTAKGQLRHSKDLDILLRLPLLNRAVLSLALQRVRSHGREWSVREEAAALAVKFKSPDALARAGSDDQARALAVLIAGFGLERYAAINANVRGWLVSAVPVAAVNGTPVAA